jgi:hypothetical protein
VVFLGGIGRILENHKNGNVLFNIFMSKVWVSPGLVHENPIGLLCDIALQAGSWPLEWATGYSGHVLQDFPVSVFPGQLKSKSPMGI